MIFRPSIAVTHAAIRENSLVRNAMDNVLLNRHFMIDGITELEICVAIPQNNSFEYIK